MINVSVVIFVKDLTRSGVALWLQRRSDENPFHPGKLEFPGGKVEVGESPRQAAIREIVEEVGVGIDNSELIFYKHQRHEYLEFDVLLHLFIARADRYALNENGFHYFSFADDAPLFNERFKSEDLIEANKNFLPELLAYFKRQVVTPFVEKIWEQSSI